ncbi:MAG: hypothetical protein EOM88_04520, partial [Clostridia bacterium]|nr:hypothetical protein [Clostridia bacterium]
MLTKKQRDIISRKRIIEQEDPIKQKVQNSIKREIEQKITPKEGESLFDKAAKFFKEYPTPISYIKKNYLTPQKQMVFRVGEGLTDTQGKIAEETVAPYLKPEPTFSGAVTDLGKSLAIETLRLPVTLPTRALLEFSGANEGSDEIKPTNKFEEFLIGKDGLKSYTKSSQELISTIATYAKEKNVNIDKKYLPMLAAGLASAEIGLDFWTGGKGNISKKIIKETTEQGSKKLAEEIGLKGTKEVTDTIMNIKTEEEANKFLRELAKVKMMQQEAKQEALDRIPSEIAQTQDKKEIESFIAQVVDKEDMSDVSAESMLTAKTQKEAKSILSNNTPKLQDLNDAEA